MLRLGSERERPALNVDLTYLLRQNPQNCIIGGNFNFTQSPYDSTNEYKTNKPLEVRIKNTAHMDVGRDERSPYIHALQKQVRHQTRPVLHILGYART
jgi:hypothetical protein